LLTLAMPFVRFYVYDMITVQYTSQGNRR